MGQTAGNTVAQSSTSFPEFQLPKVKGLLGDAEALYNKGGPAWRNFSAVAPLNRLELQGGEDIVNKANNQIAEVPTWAQSSFAEFLGPGKDPGSNPYFQNAVKAATDPVIRDFNEQVLPQIRDQAVGTGTVGSSRQALAEALATDRLGRNLLGATSTMANNAYESGQSRALSALNFAPTLQDLWTVPGKLTSGIGSQFRSYEQALLDEAAQKQDYEARLPYNNLSEYARYIMQPYGSTSSSETKVPQPSTTAQVIAAGLQVPAILQAILGLFGK